MRQQPWPQLVGAEATKPVEVTTGGSVTVKLRDGGTFVGFGKKRDAAWFKSKVDKIYFGALRLPEGDGAAAKFKVDGVIQYIRVTPAAAATSDGKWPTLLIKEGGDDDEDQCTEPTLGTTPSVFLNTITLTTNRNQGAGEASCVIANDRVW